MEPSTRERASYFAVCIAAAAAIVWLQWMTRPPGGEAVSRLMDARRISDLTEISRKVDGFVSQNGRLPASLDEVSVDSRDPRTGQPYGFRLKGQWSYELCADFDRSTGASPQFSAGHFWSHASGTECITVSADRK